MGAIVDERFEIRRRLGAGGMGEVFEAFDRERDEVVAMKTLRHPNPGALYQLKKEFRSLQDVSHPNLVSLYELVVDDDQWFFTMELVDGESLKDFVYPLDQTLPITVGAKADATPVLNVPRLRSALAQLAFGVQAVHDAGRLHRDLKPSNIMVARDGRLVILDFGVVTELDPILKDHSLDTGIAGTAAYMAPEQARGEPAQAASDWYAVGVILFEILTGRWPFTGSLARILIDKQFQRAPSPASLVADLPADLVELTSGLLETDPEERPSSAEILNKLGGPEESGTVTLGAAPGERTRLVGRRSHLADLEDAFAATQDGHGVVVHVHGPSGIGKTALVHHFLHTSRAKNQAVVLSGRCYEHEMVPYKALDGIVDRLSRYLRTLKKGMLEEILPPRVDALARLFPVLMGVEAVALQVESASESARQGVHVQNPDRPHLRRQAMRALRQLLERIVSIQPLVLHVDDLHWADAGSTRMLSDVMASPGAPAVLLVTSFRSEELAARPFLEELLRGTGTPTCRQLAVGALNEGDAREYVERALGSHPGTGFAIETIVREARGVPFFLEQLSRHATNSHSGVSAGLSLVEMLDERLRELPRGGADLLDVLAAAGRPLYAAVAARAAGVRGDLTRRLVAALKAACLVRSGAADQEIELYHDRIRQALLARLGRAERRRVHHRLLAALETREEHDPEMLLEQATRAGDGAKAAHWARRAAEKAGAALAYERAAELYRLALELEHDAAGRLELCDRLAETLAFGGRTREAADLHLELAEASAGTTALGYLQAATLEYLVSGYADKGLEVAKHLLHAVGLSMPASRLGTLAALFVERSKLRVRGLGFEARPEAQVAAEKLLEIDTCWAMASGLAMADTMRAAVFQTRHLLAALAAGEPHRIARALAMEVGFQAAPGAPARRRAEHIYERAVEAARLAGDPYAAALAMLQRGVVAYLNTEWKSAARLCDQAELLLLDSPGCAVWEVVTARRFALAALAFMGDLIEVSERLPAQLEEARERGNVYHTNELRTRINLYWLARDEPERAEAEIAEASATWSRRGFHLSHHSVLVARTQLHLYRGDGGGALAAVEEAWPRLESSLLLRIRAMRIESLGLYARSLLAAAETGVGERRRLLTRCERLSRRIRREDLPIARPLGDLIRAGAARLGGRAEAARRILEGLAAEFESCDMSLHAHAVRRRQAGLLGGDEGDDLGRRAAAAMEELGVVDVERMTRMLAPGFPRDAP